MAVKCHYHHLAGTKEYIQVGCGKWLEIYQQS